jgi:uncharacterized protein YigE (DUF2233 family)
MILMLNIVFHLLWHEAWGSTYRNYRRVAETLIAKQRLVILMLNIVFNLCCDLRPMGLHNGITETSMRHTLLSNGYDFNVKYCISFMLWHEAWGSTYQNYRNVAENPIAKQRPMILMLNIDFHLCFHIWPEGLHTGII